MIENSDSKWSSLITITYIRQTLKHCRISVDLYNFRILSPERPSKNSQPCIQILDWGRLKPEDYTMDSDKTVYTETDLSHLEQRIDELIDTVGLLKNENTTLRQQKDKLNGERSLLLEKTELARSRVEGMISRLRSLELGSWATHYRLVFQSWTRITK